MLKITVIILLMASSATHGEVQQDETKKVCSVIGMCKGLLTGSYIKPSKEECLSFCNEEDNCEWFSFNQNQSFCLHFNSCPEIDETFTKYISGESECYQESSLTKVLVSGGYEAITEIINLEDEDLTCENLEDFPMKNIIDSVGANLATSPVICGGTNQYTGDILDTCSRLINGTWETFATMSTGRYAAAGVVHENTLHVFGGREIYSPGGAILKSTDIITVDGQVRQGENLPAPLYGHAMASVNSTTSIISGGYGADFSESPLTYYYNHLTQIFTSGPSLNQGRSKHASGTVEDKKTKEKFVVVTGGSGYTDSTEILVDQHWQTGPPMPKGLLWHSMVEVNGDLYVIGGQADQANGYDQKLIHKLSCNDGNCTWTTLTQQLKYARNGQVAIPVKNSLCTAN